MDTQLWCGCKSPCRTKFSYNLSIIYYVQQISFWICQTYKNMLFQLRFAIPTDMDQDKLYCLILGQYCNIQGSTGFVVGNLFILMFFGLFYFFFKTWYAPAYRQLVHWYGQSTDRYGGTWNYEFWFQQWITYFGKALKHDEFCYACIR